MKSHSLICAIFMLSIINGYESKGYRIRAAPYYLPFDKTIDIDDILENSGLKHFILAFVLAPNNGKNCIATWNGLRDRNVLDDEFVVSIIKKIRSYGGDVSISFGGANGLELAHVCTDVNSLASIYQSVIDKYELTHIDFDIEGVQIGYIDEQTRRFEAINILKNNAHKNGKELYVSLTLPATINGLNYLAQNEIKLAKEKQTEIDLYNLMAFDFGANKNNMVNTVINVMEIFHKQIKSLLLSSSLKSNNNDNDNKKYSMNWIDEIIYQHIGMILMNGHTDQQIELFTQQTFEQLIQYALNKNIARCSFWSINRDRECKNSNNNDNVWAKFDCSSIKQNKFDFSKILLKFAMKNNSITTTTSATTTATSKAATTMETTTKLTETPSQTPTTTTLPTTISTTSKPDDDDVDCTVVINGIFPYKKDPHYFIECANGIKYILECPKNTVFDPKAKACVWDKHQRLSENE